METSINNEPPQQMPFGIALIILVLVFWIIGSLSALFSSLLYFDISRSGGTRIMIELAEIICPAVFVYGFLKRRNWSRIVFVCATSVYSAVGFMALQDVIKDIDLSKYNGKELGYVAEYFFLIKAGYILFFAAMILYVYRKRPYFNDQDKNEMAKLPEKN